MKKKELVEALSAASAESRAACERVLDALATAGHAALYRAPKEMLEDDA